VRFGIQGQYCHVILTEPTVAQAEVPNLLEARMQPELRTAGRRSQDEERPGVLSNSLALGADGNLYRYRSGIGVNVDIRSEA